MSNHDRLSPAAQEALREARSAEPRPTIEDKARIRALLAAAIAAPIAIDPAPAAASTSIGIKIGGAILALGVAGAAIVATRPAPVNAPPAPAPMKQEIQLEQPVQEETPIPAAPAKRAVKKAPKIDTPAPSRLAEEAALIRAAKAALRAGDREGALANVRAHAERFPQGELVEERVAVEAMATCNEALLPEDSAYRAAVRSSCAVIEE